MDAIWNSFLLVAATEMGDKTQLLALVLTTQFRKPWAIMAGIFFATVLNHGLASYVGSWVVSVLPENYIKWILGAIFFAFAAWILLPDKDSGLDKQSRYGAFLTTLVVFFLAEMGDKTQLSTVALAAKFDSVLFVTIGTTLGMLFSDGLAVAFGERFTERVPMKWVRIIASVLFVVFGLAIIYGY